MSKKNAEQALSDLDRYDVLIRDFGYPNDSALREIKTIIFRLRGAGLLDSYYLEKIHQMDEYAGIGFSTRRWAKYPNGASQVRVFAMGAANTARDLITEYLQK